MGIVRLGIITTLALVPRYRGKTTATSWPCATSAFGSASTTSARPPVFENGSPSDATNSILTVRLPRASQPFYAIERNSARQAADTWRFLPYSNHSINNRKEVSGHLKRFEAIYSYRSATTGSTRVARRAGM